MLYAYTAFIPFFLPAMPDSAPSASEPLAQGAAFPTSHPRPFYYLENFESVLSWVCERYGDLLDVAERDFIAGFAGLPRTSRALLVRMAMRKGDLFRASKLRYVEIGDARKAVQPLIEIGWVAGDPELTLEQLFALLTKQECILALGLQAHRAAAKPQLLEMAQNQFEETRRFSAWHANSGDEVYEVRNGAVFDRLRLMFFGNLYQDWSEFVLADLGIWNYEKVEFLPGSRAFETRQDVDLYLQLDACLESLHADEALAEIETQATSLVCANPWLRTKQAKLLFRLAQRHEQLGNWGDALRLYASCGYPGARARRIRVLEKDGRHDAAMALAKIAENSPESEAEAQQLLRMAPRLRRKLGLARREKTSKPALPRIDLLLPLPDEDQAVELCAAEHFQQSDAGSAVHFVENTLINSLFGLLCWDAIFTAVPGAFFHPFQSGPADLHDPDFHARRAPQFDACLSQLDSRTYRETILTNFKRKAGILSPFVFWDALTPELLEQALACLPPAHLKLWFERMLRDLSANCAGFPDLIQFWPQEKRYRLIEVKGPGDRLQDNQIRLLDFCLAHDMPVAACYVQWRELAGKDT